MFGICHRDSNKFLSDEEINEIGLYCRPNGDVYIKLLDSLILTRSYAAGARQRVESVSYLEMSVMADRIQRRLDDIDKISGDICKQDGMYTTPLFAHLAATGEERKRLEKRLALLKANMNECCKRVTEALA